MDISNQVMIPVRNLLYRSKSSGRLSLKDRCARSGKHSFVRGLNLEKSEKDFWSRINLSFLQELPGIEEEFLTIAKMKEKLYHILGPKTPQAIQGLSPLL